MPFVFISLPSTKGPEDANAVTSVNTSATIKNIKKKDFKAEMAKEKAAKKEDLVDKPAEEEEE